MHEDQLDKSVLQESRVLKAYLVHLVQSASLESLVCHSSCYHCSFAKPEFLLLLALCADDESSTSNESCYKHVAS